MVMETTADADFTGFPSEPVGDSSLRRFRCYDMKDLQCLDTSVKYIFDGALVADTPGVIGGREKTLKTSLALDAAISMASGTPWLGRFASRQRARVVYFAGEGGATFLRETAARIAGQKGLDLSRVENFWVCTDVPNLASDRDMREVTAVLRTYGAKFAFFDPLYLMLTEQAASATNVFAMGAMLHRMNRACEEADGVTPILLHHFKKSKEPGQAPDLADLSQAGCAEFAGQWVLINRQRAYDEDRPGEHDLIVRIGSRMGFSSKWAIHVDEGSPGAPGGRYWRPTVSTVSEARKEAEASKEAEKERKQLAKIEADKDKIVRALTQLGGVQSQRQIRDLAGLSSKVFGLGVSELIEEGKVVPGKKYVSNHKTPIPGYQLST